MAGRKVRDEAEALAIVREAAVRGVEPSAVASARGIDGRSMNAWRMTFERTGKLGQIVELVPLPREPAASYRIHCGGRVLEVGDDFCSETVRQLIEVVESC